jgi:plasmid replication initiation protein
MRALKNITSNEKDLVAVSNNYALTRKMSLTPMATKLFIWCVSQIKRTDRDIVTFSISEDDFRRSFNCRNVKRDLDRITDELMNFQIYLEDDNTGRWEKINVMSKCGYYPDQKSAELSFNKESWHCFSNLTGGGFTSGVLQIFTQIDSPYAFHVYVFLHTHLKSGTVTIDLEIFRETIGAVAQTYEKWAQLNNKILKPLQALFNEHSPIKFDYKPTGKIGRKFTQVKFFNIKKGKTQGQLLDERNPCHKNEFKDEGGKPLTLEEVDLDKRINDFIKENEDSLEGLSGMRKTATAIELMKEQGLI